MTTTKDTIPLLEKKKQRSKKKKCSSTIQLFGLLLAAATGLIASSTYFHLLFYSSTSSTGNDDFIMNNNNNNIQRERQQHHGDYSDQKSNNNNDVDNNNKNNNNIIDNNNDYEDSSNNKKSSKESKQDEVIVNSNKNDESQKLMKDEVITTTTNNKNMSSSQNEISITKNINITDNNNTTNKESKETTKKNKEVATTDNNNDCLALNSEDWINGPRLGNIEQQYNVGPESSNTNFAYNMILNIFNTNNNGIMEDILRLTLCHEGSQFINDENPKFWALRFLYLSIHIHQHRGAYEEAKLRQQHNNCNSGGVMEKNEIGTFDYECPTTKFLVVPMKEMGLGAVMRLGAVNALFAAIGTNRTLLLINNAPPKSDRNVRKKWVHASCDRHDLQCFYMPPSPCTITGKELREAYSMSKSDNRRLFKFGEIPQEHNNDRVIVSDFTLRPKHVPPNLTSTLLQYTEQIIDAIILRQQQQSNGKDNNDRRKKLEELFNTSKSLIMGESYFDREKRYYYFGVESILHHAAVFYIMRPNLQYSTRIDQIMRHAIPPNFNPEHSIGLPIRASDKCIWESECLAFPQYMKVMNQTYNKYYYSNTTMTTSLQRQQLTSIVLTTESQSVLRDKEDFFNNSDPNLIKSILPFEYDFVTNEDHDVMQETGHPKEHFDSYTKKEKEDITSDHIMLSMISSLKLQLMAKYTIGNCCSNFHLLLFHFLQSGCGAAQDNVGQCLQENEDAEFRLCCAWGKSEECTAKAAAVEKERQRLLNNSTNATNK